MLRPGRLQTSLHERIRQRSDTPTQVHAFHGLLEHVIAENELDEVLRGLIQGARQRLLAGRLGVDDVRLEKTR